MRNTCMNERIKCVNKDLYKTLMRQNEVLGAIIVQQQIVRSAVTGRDWNQLQDAVSAVNSLSKEFASLESKRIEKSLKLNSENPDDIFAVTNSAPEELKKSIIETFYQVRQKLVVSKIENDAINEYIRITQEFLQGVFDNVLPQRRNKLYSASGKMVKNQPKSVILNAIV